MGDAAEPVAATLSGCGERMLTEDLEERKRFTWSCVIEFWNVSHRDQGQYLCINRTVLAEGDGLLFISYSHAFSPPRGSEKDLKALGEHVRGVFRMREGEGGQGGLPGGGTLHPTAGLALSCAPLFFRSLSRPRVRLSGAETLRPAQSWPLTRPLTVELAALGPRELRATY